MCCILFSSCCGAELFPLHSAVFCLVPLTQRLSSTCQIPSELFPFIFPEQSHFENPLHFLLLLVINLKERSFLARAVWSTKSMAVSSTVTYFFPPEVPLSPSSQYLTSERSIALVGPTAFPSPFLSVLRYWGTACHFTPGESAKRCH